MITMTEALLELLRDASRALNDGAHYAGGSGVRRRMQSLSDRLWDAAEDLAAQAQEDRRGGSMTTEALRLALQAARDWIDAQGCRHEGTHRGGAIWTICDDCGQQWADDEGGFQPYQPPAIIAAIDAALAAPTEGAAAQQEPVAWLLTGGRIFVDQVVLHKGSAEDRVAGRNDGSRLEPLYAAQAPLQAAAVVPPDWHSTLEQKFNEGFEAGRERALVELRRAPAPQPAAAPARDIDWAAMQRLWERGAVAWADTPAAPIDETCAYPDCKCPVDAPADWCARGLKQPAAAPVELSMSMFASVADYERAKVAAAPVGEALLQRLLRELVSDVSGCWYGWPEGLRGVIGYTNYAIVEKRLREAEAAIASKGTA